ncbi:MAG: hypothetical protein M1838_004212 [Thelocarpon superellum]|nr:MAG: hypothetical protein M1838_004212 [Thelocarpon superellum]
MAGDVRDPPSSGSSTSSTTLTQDQKRYETFAAPSKSANALPGGTENTAGGRQEDLSLSTVAKTIKLEDFKRVHRQPCVRDALLLGISGGFGLGGIRAVLGAPIPTASNWAAGTFIGLSFVVYEFCQYRRHRELEGVRRAVEIIDGKNAEKMQKIEQARGARRQATDTTSP